MKLRTSFANQRLQFDHDHSQEFSPGGRGTAGIYLTNLNLDCLGIFLLVVLILTPACFPYLILILIYFFQF
jgi:hypothetical protein